MKNDQAFLNWAHNITAEVQRLLTAKRDTSSADKLGSDMREMRDALETLGPSMTFPTQADQDIAMCGHELKVYQSTPGDISDAEAVKCQAERIRDLVSENVTLRRRDTDASKALADLAAENAELQKRLDVLMAACKGMLPRGSFPV